MASKRLRNGEVEVRGEKFIFREWTSKEREQFSDMVQKHPLRAPAWLASQCTLNEKGGRVWEKSEDAEAEPPDIIDAISAAILKVSGVDVDKKPDEGEETKND